MGEAYPSFRARPNEFLWVRGATTSSLLVLMKLLRGAPPPWPTPPCLLVQMELFPGRGPTPPFLLVQMDFLWVGANAPSLLVQMEFFPGRGPTRGPSPPSLLAQMEFFSRAGGLPLLPCSSKWIFLWAGAQPSLLILRGVVCPCFVTSSFQRSLMCSVLKELYPFKIKILVMSSVPSQILWLAYPFNETPSKRLPLADRRMRLIS